MSIGSRYINIIYFKTIYDLCYAGRMYDRRRSWLALSVPCHVLGTGPRHSTHGTHKLGLTGYNDAEYIVHLNGPN